MPKPPQVSTSRPDATDESWIEHALKEQQQAPARLEDTAKFLVGIVSISLTIFISKRPEGYPEWTDSWLMWATLVWVLSTLLAFFVFFPWRYRLNRDSPEDIQRAYRKITRVKRWLLVFSLGCYLVALGLAGYVFVVSG